MPADTDRLRPGLHVVRRDAERVQVGLDPPHRVIVAADAEGLDLLRRLRDGGPAAPHGATQHRIVHDLRVAGLLVDAREPAAPTGTVGIRDHGFAEGAARLADLLAGAGVASGDATSDLVVVCSTGPLSRAAVDPLLAEGTPHLVVCGTGEPGSLRVGPLVEPGVTACLRCVDAAESGADPRRPLVLEQLAAEPAAPVDPLTLAIALAWAVRDVVAFLAGESATTWSASVDAHLPSPTVRPWARHPDCGCCWDELPY